MNQIHPDWLVLNRGVNGERTDQILDRFDRDARMESPRYVVVLGGVNDVYQGYPPDFTRRNLGRIFQMAIDAKIVPVAASILPYNSMNPKQATTIRGLNGWIRSESESRSIPFADTNLATASSSDPDKLSGSPDGLHPDVRGYRKMGETIAEVIQRHLAKP